MGNNVSFPKYSGIANANVYKAGNGDVILTVGVKDERIRGQGIQHDGYEDVFALIRNPQTGNWDKHKLQYTGSWTDRGGGGPTDSYELRLPAGQWDYDALKNHGVAFGIDVAPSYQHHDPTTVWLQYANDNYRLND
jgi:hypothetical protein